MVNKFAECIGPVFVFIRTKYLKLRILLNVVKRNVTTNKIKTYDLNERKKKNRLQNVNAKKIEEL